MITYNYRFKQFYLENKFQNVLKFFLCLKEPNWDILDFPRKREHMSVKFGKE